MSEKNETDLTLPNPITKYLIMTLNKKGPCSNYIDQYAQQFIDYASQQNEPVLELGACYGFVTIESLKAGAKVIANDIEPRHLNILYNQTPQELRQNLTLLPGEFPNDVHLPDQSISGCYVARMLGYLEPTNLQIGLEKIFALLKNNAKFFILASTPYKGFLKKLIPLYEQRVIENQKWPGYFPDLKTIIGERWPDSLHFFDEKILTRELKRVGFIIEKIEEYPRLDLPGKARLDGREGIVAIARKP